MSFIVTNPSIKLGLTSTIIISNLYNVYFLPDSSIINIELTANGTYTALVKPLSSTIYYIFGYNQSNQITNLNATVYVNVTPDLSNITVNYNNSVTLNVSGSNTYLWYPNTYLNTNTGSSVICTPLKDITYTIIGTDKFLTISSTSIKVNVNTGLTFTPSNPTVYDGNLLKVSVESETILDYTWESNLFNNLSPYCVTYKYGNSITIHPYNSVFYTVNGYQNGNLITSGTVNINVITKPSNIIDVDILPYKLSNIILNRNTIELKKELVKDKILSKKIINFYYNTLQTAYRMEWTNKNGIPFKINWETIYQIVNESNSMILSFEQQWNFFKYINSNQTINGNTLSNFAYLLNNINEIYLEYPQKIYITPLMANSV